MTPTPQKHAKSLKTEAKTAVAQTSVIMSQHGSKAKKKKLFIIICNNQTPASDAKLTK